jgi:predicted  nucleic acid-binding Zn-ribbon protein
LSPEERELDRLHDRIEELELKNDDLTSELEDAHNTIYEMRSALIDIEQAAREAR